MVNDLLLAQLVKTQPALYDKSHLDFKYLDKRDQAWDEISHSLNITSSDCKSRWLRLREKFARELKAIKVNEDPDARSQWPLFDAMQFLKNHVKARGRRSNFRTVHEASLPEIYIPGTAFIIPETVENNADLPSGLTFAKNEINRSPSEDSIHSIVSAKMEEESRSETCVEENQFVDIKSEVGRIADFLKTRSTECSDLAFGRFIGVTLKEMPPKKKILFRRKIMQALEEMDDNV